LDSELLNDFLLTAFPNPERKGCPDEGTLQALAEGRLPLNEAAGTHLGSCSECYAEYRHYRLDWKEANERNQAELSQLKPVASSPVLVATKAHKSPGKVVAYALAASVLVICGAAIAYRHEHTPSPTLTVASVAPVNATVDLFNAVTLRGVGDAPAPLQSVFLPAAIVNLSITLPRFSQSGDYEVVVSSDKAGRQLIAKSRGMALDSSGKVALSVTLDLRSAKAGEYFLATVRGSDNGTYYYPLQVK
jgi:hypothetical protein